MVDMSSLPPKTRIGKQPSLVIASLLGLILLATTGLYTWRKATTPTVNPTPVTLPQIKAITALGRLEPQGEVIKVAPPPDLGGAKIQEIRVKEGDRVKKGDTLAILDTLDKKQREVEVAQAQLEVSQANLEIIQAGAKTGDIQAQAATIKRLEAELTGALATSKAKIARLQAQKRGEKAAQSATLARLEAELNNAQRELQRYTILGKEGAISDADLDQKRLTLAKAREVYEEAQATYSQTQETLNEEITEAQAIYQEKQASLTQAIQEAEAKLNSIAQVREVDVNKARAEVSKAAADLAKVRADLAKAYVKAPQDGQILKVYSLAGEQVNATEGILELGNTAQMLVIAEVYETDINRVRLGQTARVKSENGTFVGELTGKVSEVGLKIGKKDVLNTDPAADIDVRVVEVKIKLDADSSQKIKNLTYAKVVSRIEE